MRQKILYLGIYGLEFENNIVIFEISTLKFAKNEFLTNTVNFGKGPSFCKSPGSTFSQGPSQGLGPLYKVFQK